MAYQTPYERKQVKTGKWNGTERRRQRLRQLSPQARRYRDRMFFFQLLSLVLFINSLILAWYAFLSH